MEELSSFIEREVEAILGDWQEFARNLSPGGGLSASRLKDHAKEILLAAARDMRQSQSGKQQIDKGKGDLPGNSPDLSQAAESHAFARMGDQFSLNDLVAEFRALRASVLRRWAASGPSGAGTVDQLTRFNEAVDQAMAASMSHDQRRLEEGRAVILGVLAHDLRNPLNAISLGTQFILQTEPLDSRAAQAAARTLNSVSKMKALVQDLLDYTLTRLGTVLPIHPQPRNIELIARGVVKEVEASYPGREVNCISSCDPKGVWDLGRISQMMSNLLVNALQHGDAEHAVDLHLGDVAGGVRTTVTNQGEAIPQSERSTLFEPMKAMPRRTGARRPGSSGLGLGLYIVAEIAAAHGGSVELASSDRDGTVFAVNLPRRPVSS